MRVPPARAGVHFPWGAAGDPIGGDSMRLPSFVAQTVLALGALGCIAPEALALSYSMQILAPLEYGSRAEDLNEAGAVVGWAGDLERLYPARWQTPSALENLGLLDADWPYAYGFANAINASGDVVGYSATEGGERGFRWSTSGGIEAVEVVPGQSYGDATDVNDLGQIALDWDGAAWLVEPDGMVISLGALNADGRARPRDVTNTGMVAGISSLDSGVGRGFVWTREEGIRAIEGLGPDGWSAAFGANDRGEVVGMAGYEIGDATRRAFLWSEAAGIRDLGTGDEEESIAYDVNELGQVVGVALTMGSRAVAALWDPALGFIDLNGVVVGRGDLSLDEAVAINDRGQIAANAIIGGARRGVLLTPIPEPSTAILVGAGAAWLARRRRH